MFLEIVQNKLKLKDFGTVNLNGAYKKILKTRKGVLLHMRVRHRRVNKAAYEKSKMLYNKTVLSILDAISQYEINQDYDENTLFYAEIVIWPNGLRNASIIEMLQKYGVYILNTKESRLPKKKSQELIKKRVREWKNDFSYDIKTNYDFVIFLVSILPKYALSKREHRLLAGLYCFGYQKEKFKLHHKQNKKSSIEIECSYFDLFDHLHSPQYQGYWCKQRFYTKKFLRYYQFAWYSRNKAIHRIDFRALSQTMFRKKCNLDYDFEKVAARIKTNGFNEKQLAKLFLLKRR